MRCKLSEHLLKEKPVREYSMMKAANLAEHEEIYQANDAERNRHIKDIQDQIADKEDDIVNVKER